jgi:hypothetical protein
VDVKSLFIEREERKKECLSIGVLLNIDSREHTHIFVKVSEMEEK